MEIGCKPSNSIPMHVELVIMCECDSNQFKLTWTITNLQYIFFSIFHLHTNTNSDSDKTQKTLTVTIWFSLRLLFCYWYATQSSNLMPTLSSCLVPFTADLTHLSLFLANYFRVNLQKHKETAHMIWAHHLPCTHSN